MNCPTCHARLLPVKGQLFCLQCGEIIADSAAEPEGQPALLPTPVRKPVADLASRAAGIAGPRVVPAKPGSVEQPAVSGWHRRYLPWPLIVGLALIAVVVVGNVLARSYYQDRVYPGVQVANRALGGQPLDAVDVAIKQALPVDTVRFTIGTTEYAMKPSELGGTTNAAELVQQVRDAGRTNPFALFGVAETLMSKPLQPQYQVDERTVGTVADRLAADNNHPAVDAAPIIVGTTPVVIAEKAGLQVDRAKLNEGLLTALKRHQKVTISATKLTPAIAAASYAADAENAQAKIGLSLSVKVRTATISPSAEVIAGWLRFGEPGSGAQPDPGKVAAYVAGIPGRFDRPAAEAAILASIQAKQPLVYTAATTRRNVAARTIVPLPPAAKTYSFCSAVRGAAGLDVASLTTKAQATLDNPHGWTLGGSLKFLSSSSNCNVTIWVASASEMAGFAPACAKQSTCQVGNNVVINASNWAKAPADWKGSLEEYRAELINHEIGHWLGFDHAKCSATSPVAPLAQPTLIVSGCSPQWHAIPAELQGRKVLPGF